MTGERRYPYPRWVWSPAGGWWNDPPHWRRNTAIVYVGVGLVCWGLYNYSTPREYRINRITGEVRWGEEDPRYKWNLQQLIKQRRKEKLQRQQQKLLKQQQLEDESGEEEEASTAEGEELGEEAEQMEE